MTVFSSVEIYWLFEPNQEKEGSEILNIFKSTLEDLDIIGNFTIIDSCNKAFKEIQPGRIYDIRVFKTKKHSGCYSEGIYNHIKSSVHNRHGINIEILQERERSRTYDWKERKITITHEQAKDRKLIKSIFRTFLRRPKVYISYGNDNKQITNSTINRLRLLIDAAIPFIEIKIDQDMGFKDNVNTFMEEISSSDHVISLINEKYLHSEYCMRELIGMIDKSSGQVLNKDKIYPIVMPSAKIIHDSLKLIDIVNFWKIKADEARSITASNPEFIDRFKQRIDDLQRSGEIILHITDTIGKWAAAGLEDHRKNNFSNLIWLIYSSFYSENDKLKFFPLYNNQEEMSYMLKKVKTKNNLS